MKPYCVTKISVKSVGVRFQVVSDETSVYVRLKRHHPHCSKTVKRTTILITLYRDTH